MMKKGIIAIGVLVLVIALEALALYAKSKNPEPVAFALDEQEYSMPVQAVKVQPFVFETNFVEIADRALDEVQSVIENSFARHVAQSVAQDTLRKEQNLRQNRERKEKLDAFRQAMAEDPVEINGIYLGDNVCEVDGVAGVCANGVYKLGAHCIACYDGLCAGAKCPPKKNSANDGNETDETVETPADNQQENTPEEKAEVAPESEQIDLSSILRNAEAESKAEMQRTKQLAEETAAEAELQAAADEKSERVEAKAEIVPAEDASLSEPKEYKAVKSEEKVANSSKKQIAVVIDDLGLSIPFTNQIAKVNKPLTVAFLPYGASDKGQVGKLKNAGFEVMLHVPMMPRVPADLAPVTLSPKMSKEEIQEKLAVMLERFSGMGMGGINNHMGSAFTENREAMAAVAEVLKEQRLFFLDSMTTSKSVGRSVCREYGVPYISRDVFLDNERKYDYIMGQFRAAERVAQKKGYAVAIGHPYPQTLQVLRDWLNDVENRNIEIVPLSVLVNKLNKR